MQTILNQYEENALEHYLLVVKIIYKIDLGLE